MLEAIRARRSVRFYKDDPVRDADIAEVLRAGFCAPSAHGNAPWHVVVVREAQVRQKIGSIHKWTKIVARAPVAVVVCVDRSGFDHFWVEDASAFLENVLVQAAELGLGSCWIGLRDLHIDGVDAEAVVREACGLPDHFGVLAMTPLGYPARYPGAHEPVIPADRVRYI